ncbi:MAG: tRNA preQ1(34) S-adenosylmethionine ribosyltransferase-isomerase QueA, partial [Burkholderiales bacterium]
MQRSDFFYVLPPHLIAQFPSRLRRGSRLLSVQAGQLQDLQFADFPRLLRKGDLLVFNDT